MQARPGRTLAGRLRGTGAAPDVTVASLDHEIFTIRW